MASIFFRRKKETGLWWIKARSAQTRALVRASLQTRDEAMAQLIKRRIELEIELRRPELASLEIPKELLAELEILSAESPASAPEAAAIAPATTSLAPTTPAPMATTVSEAITCYYRHCQDENSPAWLKNKISYLRAFFGSKLVDSITDCQGRNKVRGYFHGNLLSELTALTIRNFLDGKDVGKKTKRHYREMFHDFFAVLTRYNLYAPTNWVSPNPVAALPSYLGKSSGGIVFLNAEECVAQYRALTAHPSLNAAVHIMIGAGLRRSECLWLRTEDFAADLSHMRVLFREDEETEDENSLKTGQRPVTIIPALREFLKEYLSTIPNGWVVPSPRGQRWNKDNFSKALRLANRAAKLSWTCNEYRHTFATDRAKDGWSLFRLAKEMGNSQAIVERYYAAFVAPEWQQAQSDVSTLQPSPEKPESPHSSASSSSN